MAGAEPSASVVLCTRNRRELLAVALASILRCDLREGDFEVLVVDNGSSDGSDEVVDGIDDARVRLLREARVGKHYAQHLGAREARSRLLLYTDDDVEVARGWVQAYVDAFRDHPALEAAGGPVRPIWEHEPPAWLVEYMAEDAYAVTGGECCGPLALVDRGGDFLVGADGYFFGNNMAIRYDALRRFGGFRPGRAGRLSIGPGEWALVDAMRRSGTPIGYVPEALVYHHVPSERMTPRFMAEWPGPQDEMFERWHRRRRTVGAVGADAWRIVRSSIGPAARAAVGGRRQDAASVRRRVDAARGRLELRWLWWMVTRRELRVLLDTEHFGP